MEDHHEVRGNLDPGPDLAPAEAAEMQLPEGRHVVHPGLPLCAHLLLQRGVQGRGPAEAEQQLPEIEVDLCLAGADVAVAAGHVRREAQRRGEEVVPGQVVDRRRADEEVRGGRGGDDASPEEEPNGGHPAEEYDETKEDRPKPP